MGASKIRSAIDIAHIATSKDVTVTFSDAFFGTYLTTMDVDLRLSENVTIGIEAVDTTIT